MREEMLDDGLISPEDVDLLFVTDDPREVVEIVVSRYEQRASRRARPDAGRRRGRRADPGARPTSSRAVGVVLGSGLGGLADEIEDRVEIPYDQIPGWPVSTAVGHAGRARAR